MSKEPSRARRFMAPLYVLVALAGFFLVLSAGTPRLSAPAFGFLAVAAGLLLGGLADLGAGGSPGARASLRVAGFALGISGLLAVLLASVLSGG
ncbi:hypothetical protein GBA65_10795 [Rubrobacter marinus]|uniref:Uncharacterized protein n=1 Tax=Rubrobacter marinus TaxID=2653852 RepID=A0A6G8PXI3_9ACTN|nr:hypothetical protein [Rubrobacter marinus]QIN78929.1 hypothetical protein GBA65_10795 [Rubrobacter marinus]